VLELSSFQLETTQSLHTATSTVLNVTPDHMDRYATLADYAASKARIFEGCDVAVINADDAAVRAMPRPGQRVLSFSLESRGADYTLGTSGTPTITRRGEALLPLDSMRLQGLHNAANDGNRSASRTTTTLPFGETTITKPDLSARFASSPASFRSVSARERVTTHTRQLQRTSPQSHAHASGT